MADLPTWWANAISAVIFAGIAVGVFFVPRASLFRDAPDHSAWRDIRLWAVVLVIVQLAIYATFA